MVQNYPNGTYSSLIQEELKTDKVGDREGKEIELQSIDKNKNEKDEVEAKKMKEADANLMK